MISSSLAIFLSVALLVTAAAGSCSKCDADKYRSCMRESLGEISLAGSELIPKDCKEICPKGELTVPILVEGGSEQCRCIEGVKGVPCVFDSNCKDGKCVAGTELTSSASGFCGGEVMEKETGSVKSCPATFTGTTDPGRCSANLVGECKSDGDCISNYCTKTGVCGCPAKGTTSSLSKSGSGCVDAEWLHAKGYRQREMVHASAITKQVLCPIGMTIPCGTPDHAVKVFEQVMSYRDLCTKNGIECASRVLPVNSLWTHHRDAISGIPIGEGTTLYMHDVRFPFALQYILHTFMSSSRALAVSIIEKSEL